jgi:serine/threonine protein kinase
VIKDSSSRKSTDEPEVYKGIYEELVRKAMNMSDAIFGSSSRPPFYKEAYIQGLLTPESRATQSDTVRLRGYRRGNAVDPHGSPGSVHWRLFMDHCYAGDLSDFIDHYEEMGKPIPEPFIWWTMECLASALVQIEICARARSHARKQKDETIVMVDMKPKNIFLDGAGYSKRYPIYPRPKIGEFGAAHLTHMQDPANIFCRLEVIWSRGFLAPELSKPYHSGDEKEAIKGGDEDEDGGGNEDEDEDVDNAHVEEEKEYLPLYSWTNVWQLGRTIECMMRLRYSRDRNWNDNTINLDSQIKVDPPRHRAGPDFLYSQDLIDIVWQCGQYDARHLVNLWT